jgi:hypothetical protein
MHQRIASFAAAIAGAFVLAAAPWAAPASAQGAPVDVAVSLRASDSTPNPGQRVTFTTLVENKLSGTASPVRIKFFRHPDFDNVRIISAPGFSCDVFPLEIVCNGGQVSNERDIEIVFTARAPRSPAEYRVSALFDNSSGKFNDVDRTNNLSRIPIIVNG